jgi:glycosyltransferase involved in cell wall biosynthesis
MLAISRLAGEIIVVDDSSTDDSCRLLEETEFVRLLRHDRNRGYGAALKTGMRAAIHPWIVIVDADGTYPLEAIPEIVAGLEDYEMVVGSRTGPLVTYPLVRKVPKLFLKLFAEWIAGQQIPDLNSGLRAFRRADALRFERLLPEKFSFTTTLTLAMLTSGLRVRFSPINYAARVGRSKFRPVQDTWNFWVTILRLGVYFAPLKIFLPVSAILGFSGLWTLAEDIFVRQDLTERTLILLMTSLQIGFLALLADMIVRNRN